MTATQRRGVNHAQGGVSWLREAGVDFSTDPEVLAVKRADRSGWPPDGHPSAVVFRRLQMKSVRY